MLSYVTRASAGFKVWLPSSASPTLRQAPSLARDKYLFNGLRPSEKRAEARGEEPAAHGGEECAARMVKTKADALGYIKKNPFHTEA